MHTISFPQHLQAVFIEEIRRGLPKDCELQSCRGEDLLVSFTQDTGYLLRMYWLGRADKIPPRLMPALDWATRHGLPERLRKAYRGFSAGNALFVGEDHHELARCVMRQTYQACCAIEGSGLPALDHSAA